MRRRCSAGSGPVIARRYPRTVPGVQNKLVMRPEVRAEYERARDGLEGGDAFAVRLERFFSELWEPLRDLYGDAPRLPGELGALLRSMAALAASRPAGLRVLDHEREITPD